MYFVLSKVLGFFASASNLLIVLALAGLVLMGTRFAPPGRRIAVGSLIALAVVGFSPFGNILTLVLEDRFPPWDAARGAPDGVVVLGGAISCDVSEARGEASLNEAAERVTAAVELARRYPAARILYSGGTGALLYREGNEADIAIALFERLGVARERLIVENRSRNTEENAVFSKAVAAPKPGERWLLVTSASHMPRAVAYFRAADFPIEAYPVDWRTRGTVDIVRPFYSLSDGLRRTDTAMREWAGLIVGRLTGRTSELFPRPSPAAADPAGTRP